MRRWLPVICFCLLSSIKVLAIDAVASHSLFYLSGNPLKPYVELYWQVAPSSVNISESSPGRFNAKIRTDISFKSEGKVVLEDHYILQTTPGATKVEAAAQMVLEFKKYILPPGNLQLELKLCDVADTGNHFIYSENINPSVVTDKPLYSSVQILDTVFTSAQKSIFIKNGKMQIPLCANFFDKNRNSIFFYTELYNTNAIAKELFPLTQTAYISRKAFENNGTKLQFTDTFNNGGIRPTNGKFDISSLSSGNFYINVVLNDNKGRQLAASNVFFQRQNTKEHISTTSDTGSKFQQVEVFDLGSTFVIKYTPAQLRAILKMIKPISTPVEVVSIDNFLQKPDEMYMRYFIYNFWKERNTSNPKSAWEEYSKLVKEVRRMFDAGSTPGYETERGVIYLKYGKPDEMVTVSNEEGAEPYQIWLYNTLSVQSQGGMFLFYQPGFMLGDYRVLHSNVKGEVRNLDWRSILYKNGKQSNMSNSRAEQYFPGSK